MLLLRQALVAITVALLTARCPARVAAKLRRAYRKAHGARRKTLRSRYLIQRQSIPVADSHARSACARRVLTGFPWE